MAPKSPHKFIIAAVAAALVTVSVAQAQTGLGSECNVSAADQEYGPTEQEYMRIYNDYRESIGLRPLEMSRAVQRAAGWQSRAMTEQTDPLHTDKYGRGPGTRMTDCGFKNIYTYRGEAVAVSVSYASPQDVFNGWDNHEGHKQLLEDPIWTHAGVKRVYDPESQWGYYWTLDLTSGPNTPDDTFSPNGLPGTLTATPTLTLTPLPTPTSAGLSSPTPTSTPPVIVASTEKLINGGFESGNPDGWSWPAYMNPFVQVVPDAARTGSYGLRMAGRGYAMTAMQIAPARPGEVVTVSGWYQVPAAYQGNVGAVELVAVNTNGSQIQQWLLTSLNYETVGWQYLSAQRTMPARTAGVILRFRFPQLQALALFDDWSVRGQ